MGLFDVFMSDERKIQRHQRRLTNRDAQDEDREASAHWLADQGSPQALLALLSRFDMSLDHQLKDSGEKELVYGLLIGVGREPLSKPLHSWMRQCKQLAMPLKLLHELEGQEIAIEMVYELLARELEKDDFKPGKKRRMLTWLAEKRHPGAIDAAAPFLRDFDENVRCAAAEVIILQESDAGRPSLLEALANPEEDSNRLRTRVAGVFANRRWSVGDVDLAGSLPESFVVRGDRIERVS